jgi:hypothetical protein
MDDASGGVDCRVYFCVVFGALLVFVVQDLDAEKFGYQNRSHCTETYQKFVFPV